jgi:hypothetical protein
MLWKLFTVMTGKIIEHYFDASIFGVIIFQIWCFYSIVKIISVVTFLFLFYMWPYQGGLQSFVPPASSLVLLKDVFFLIIIFWQYEQRKL